MIRRGPVDQGRESQRVGQTQPKTPGFGRMLREYRLAAGLTQDALAERALLSVRGIADLERGARRFPYEATLERLAAALNLSSQNEAIFRDAARSGPRRLMPTVGNVDSAVLSEAVSGDGYSLPLQLTSLVGREHEVVEVQRLLWTTRLLTLAGVGGIG